MVALGRSERVGPDRDGPSHFSKSAIRTASSAGHWEDVALHLPMHRVEDPAEAGQPAQMLLRDPTDSALVRSVVDRGKRAARDVVVVELTPVPWADDEEDDDDGSW